MLVFKLKTSICWCFSFVFHQCFLLCAEYVATLFPHYDFRKCGKDCENYVFYVKCLMAFAASTEVEETPVSYFSFKYDLCYMNSC